MTQNSQLLADYNKAKTSTDAFRSRWDDFLNIAYARLLKSNGSKSRISTGDLSNLIIERSARVAARIPTGKIFPLSKDDGRKAAVINLAWNSYVIKKANWQYPMRIKLMMWDFYSLVYGIMPMFHGYQADEQYIGPNCRLVDLRFIAPQPGRLSPNDADYVYHETFHSKSELKKMIGNPGWVKETLNELLNSTPSSAGEQSTPTQNERGESVESNGMYKLITKYTRGYGSDWITFDEKGNIVRTIKNPFKSGRIPIVFKMAFPLIDSFWGLGDVERGESLQRAINSITNLAIDYLKVLIFPPLTISKGMRRSDFPFKPGAVWKLDKTAGEMIETAQLNQAPAGLVNQLGQSFKGSLLNQNGTTDTTISSQDGLPGYGKTPQALEKLEQRESSRDNFDRQMFEAAVNDLFEGMLEELGTRQTLPMTFDIFEDEIANLEEGGFADKLLGADHDKTYSRVELKAKDLQGGYKFDIDVGSSAENDDKEEFERTQVVIDMLQSPFGEKVIQYLEANGETIDYKVIFEQFLAAAKVKNREKMIIPSQQSEQPTAVEHAVPSQPQDYSEDYNDKMVTNEALRQIAFGEVN